MSALPSPILRLVQRIGAKKWFVPIGKRLVPLDAALQRWTKGKVSLSSPLGVPAVMLTTTGRKSGQPRSVPLLLVRHDDGYVAIGSNWGGQRHPAWSGNLLANPRAEIQVSGRTVPVTARLATGAEREQLWQKARQVWPGYDSYAERAVQRNIRVFLLTPRIG